MEWITRWALEWGESVSVASLRADALGLYLSDPFFAEAYRSKAGAWRFR